MRIYTKAGDLAFSTFTFPDGQPHFKLETYELEFRDVTIEMAIRSPHDLFMLLLVNEVLRRHGYSNCCLDIRYLLAARMDRAIDVCQPFSLDVVARLINSCGFNRVRILDAHSEVATRLIRNSVNVLPYAVVRQVKETLGYPWVVCPDKGAKDRVLKLADGYHILGDKVREMSTGKLSGFTLTHLGVHLDTASKKDVLIIDDICDGGRTFSGLAEELKKAGADRVYLFVTHGIFSGLTPIPHIAKIFTTDSYYDHTCRYADVTVIPISMEKL